jgi:DNA excision repair protein ERCC-2
MSFRIAVRELCEFTAKSGDLDLRFTPAPSAEEGMEGHRVVASRRGADYEAELPLAADYGALRLRGRCDGYDPVRNVLEEIKTHRGPLERLPDNQRALHWAQARLYAAMLCAERGLDALEVALVYFDVGTQKETVLTEHCTAQELQAFFTEHCERFLRWAEQEMAHRTARDEALTVLQFPYGEFRHGQRLLAEGVYRAARDGRCLMAQAPTGIGKTLGTLFPLLKACPTQALDRVFFLTAKTPGRALALDALKQLFPAGWANNVCQPEPAPVGWVTPGYPRGLASPGATSADPSAAPINTPGNSEEDENTAAIETIAADARVGNPESGLPTLQNATSAPPQPVGWVNSVYPRGPASNEATADQSFKAMEHAQEQTPGETEVIATTAAPDTAATVDKPASSSPTLRVLELTARDKACVHPDKQCHGESCPLAAGFYDRLPAARAAAVAHGFLDKAALQAIAAQHAICPYYLAQELARWSDVVVGDYNYYFDGSALLYALTVARDWKVAVLADEAHNLVDRAREMYSAELQPARLAALRKTVPTALKRPLGRLQKVWDALHDASEEYECGDDLPDELIAALHAAVVKIADHQARHPQELNPDLQHFYFDMLHFLDLYDTRGPHAFVDILTPPAGTRALRLRNVIPAPYLIPRIEAAHTLTLFSATLTPPKLHQQLLGLPEDTVFLDVPSPFSAQQLRVRIVDGISTRYQHREASLAPIAALMATQYRQRPGNYLAFFSSHDYLQRALTTFRAAHPDIPVRDQARGMSEAARRDFLEGFGEDTEGIAFAVLGGAFGEGIDLPGRRLIGAFVATLGLPQVNAMNEKVRSLLEARFQAGYDYTYLYPGLQKVVQAAGRVIRTPQDEGVVYLIDDRFRQPRVRALLPAWWQPV